MSVKLLIVAIHEKLQTSHHLDMYITYISYKKKLNMTCNIYGDISSLEVLAVFC